MMKKFVLLCLLLSIAICEIDERIISAPSYSVEDLEARRFSDGRILVISGYIQNNSFKNTMGEVIIYIKQGNTVIQTIKGVVNKSLYFEHGKKGFFETVVNIEPTLKLDTVLVEYMPVNNGYIK